ncbi:MAG: Uncharacterized protein CEN90_622 [Parcubacteria group bacterium Licking1014_17]|nr:MAG: Uncharacterized protein CEN90_622 [Parcubacteria group bacterium Licking1014_17]
MITFLYGKDSYRLKLALADFTEKIKKSFPETDFTHLDLSEAGSLNRLEDNVKIRSFFGAPRCLILTNAFHDPDNLAGLIHRWKIDADKEINLIVSEYADASALKRQGKELFALLNGKKNKVLELPLFKKSDYPIWIKSEFKKRGITADQKAVLSLLDFSYDTGAPKEEQELFEPHRSYWLGQEIDKLANYAAANKKTEINHNDVALLTSPRVRPTVFEVTDALLARNRRAAFRAIHKQMESDIEPPQLLAIIAKQFRAALQIKGLRSKLPAMAIAQRFGFHPYVAQKISAYLSKWEMSELIKIFGLIAEADKGSKAGVTEMEDSLYSLAFAV